MNKKTELLLGGLILGASYVQAIDNSSIDRIKVREMMTHLYESFGSIPGIIPPKHEVDKTPVNFGEARNSLFPYALQRVEDIEARLDYDEDEEEAEEDAEFMAFLSLMGISDEGDDLQHRAADSRRHHASNIKQPIVAYGVTTSAPQSVSALTEELLETLSKEEKRDEPANELIIEVMNQLLICTSEQIITNLIDEIIQKNGWRAIARLSDENIEANSALKNVLNAPYNHAKYHSVFAFPVIAPGALPSVIYSLYELGWDCPSNLEGFAFVLHNSLQEARKKISVQEFTFNRISKKIDAQSDIAVLLDSCSVGPFINFPELFGLVVDDSNLDVSFVSTLLKYIFNSDCWGFYDKDFCKRIFRFKDEESHPFEREGNDFMESLGHSFEVKGILDFRYSALNSNGPLVKFLSDNRFFEMDPETKDIRVKEELESFLPFMAMYHDFKKYTFFVNLSDLLKEQSKELEFSNHLDASEFGIKHQFIIAYLQYLHEHVLLNNDALLALKFESRLVDEQSIPDLTEALSLEDTFRESALKLEKILISDVKAEDGRSFPYQMVDEEGEFNVRYARHSLLDCLLIITGNSIEVNKRIERKQDFLIKFFDQPDNRQGNSLLLLKSINDINNDFSNIESILKEAIKKLNQRTYCIITNKSAMCSVFFRLSVLNYDYMVEENPEKKDFLLKTMICVAAYLMQGLPHCLSGKEAAFSESLKTLMDYKNQSTEDYGINYFVHQMTENLLKHIFEFRELSDGKFKVPEEAVMFLTAIRSFLSVNDDDDSDDISFQAYGLYGVETSESENKIENLVPFLNFFQHSDDRIVSMVREKMNKRKSYRLLTEMHSVLEKDSEDEDEDDDLCFTAMCSLSEGPFYEELVTTIWDYAMHPDIFLPFFVEGFAKIGETGTQLLKSFIKTKYQIVLDDEFLKKIPEETRTKIIYLLLLENNFIKPPSN